MNRQELADDRGSPAILYVGNFRFPEGDAAAARVLGIGRALRDSGYEVVFCGGEEKERPEDRRSTGEFAYQGFRYHSMNEFRTRPLPPLRRVLRYFKAGANTLRWLNALPPSKIVAVVAYQGNSRLLSGLQAFCRRLAVPLIVDCAEWYEPSHFPGGRLGIARWDNELRLRVFTPRAGNVIAISRRLETYFRSKACHVLRIPPLVDLEEEKWKVAGQRRPDDGALRLVYAGTPGKKDLLANALLAMQAVRRGGASVVADLFGPSPADVAACMAGRAACLTELAGAINYRGRVPQHRVPSHLAASDFSMLLRPNARYANAGFPTKLVESLSAGVPIITNSTSDIPLFVRDGLEGILLSDPSPDAFAAGLRRVLEMGRDKWTEMRDAAARRARECFDFRNYRDAIGSFVAESISRAQLLGRTSLNRSIS
jgi:glycosyltransferase involved in cell wall biosynthesis